MSGTKTAKVEMFYKPMCPYCVRARNLLKGKGVEVNEYNAFIDADHRKAMIERAKGARTYPQIFIDGRHVGGSDDLAALERAGKLDALLAG